MNDRSQHPVLELIHRRISAADFDRSRAISQEQLSDLVRDATRAPSSFNIQHWRFIAVRGAQDKKKLQSAAYDQEQVSAAPLTFIILGDTRGVERLPEIMELAVERGALPEGKAAAWVRMAREIYRDEGVARDEAMRSGSLAAMTMMLAAEARGLVAGALTGFDPERVRQEFGIPEHCIPVMLLAVGYPTAVRGRSRMPRLPLDEVLHLDRWQP